MDWTQVLTFIGTNVVMFLWMVRENNQDRREFHALIREIRKDMSDFHNKLAMQDMEFKNHMRLIEERNKTK